MGRLNRLQAIYLELPLYFITACAHGRRPLLANDEAHPAFQRFSEKAMTRGVFVGYYLMMPDHIHFFMRIGPEAPSLSHWMGSMKNAVSSRLRKRGFASPYWQKSFFDHLLRSAASYQEKLEYVRQNPVRAGLVKQPDDWPYQGEICRFFVQPEDFRWR